MNYCLFILSLWITAISAQTTAPESLPSTTTAPDSSKEVYQLCLYLNSITIDDPNPISTLQDADNDATGIFYVYSQSTEDTFQSLEFPITPQIEKDIETAAKTVSKELKMLKLPMDARVGCWDEPQFHELMVRFKVYQLYHTALKAVSSVLVPAIGKGPATQQISLETLAGQMHGVQVEVELTLSWSKHHVELSAPITPLKPIWPIDSDEVTNAMVVQDHGIYFEFTLFFLYFVV